MIPCCSSKQGVAVPELGAVSVADFLEPDDRQVLIDGRHRAWAHHMTTLDTGSPLRPALAYYTGQPYQTPGFRDLLVSALGRGLHCLIVSGGYGLLRPEEPIHRYSAHMPTQTRSIWTNRLRRLLPGYVDWQKIRRAFVAVSASYAACLPRGFASEEWWAIPEFDPRRDRGSAMQIVPRRVGTMATELLQSGIRPGDGWLPES